ncbi:MAG: hypothetical protein V1846_04655 [Candidatus Komeilibacteria bacterium]
MIEKYTWEKAQDEASTLSQKVETGEALDYDSAEQQLDADSLTEEQKGYKEELLSQLKAGKADLAARLKSKLLPEVMQSQEVRQAIIEQFVYNLSNGYDHINDEMLQDFPLSASELQQAVLEALISALNYIKDVYTVQDILEKYSFPPEVIQSAEVQQAAKVAYTKLLAGHDKIQADKIKELFFLQ